MITPLDVALILLALVIILRGAWVGLVRQISFLAGLLLGFLAAGRYFETFSPLIQPLISSPQIAFLVTYFFLFLLVYLSAIGIGIGLRKVVQISLLTWFDRLTGAVFGLCKAYLFVVFLFLASAGILSPTPAFLQKSLFFPIVEKSAKFILPIIKDPEVRKRFLPKEPAIKSIFTGSQTEKKQK